MIYRIGDADPTSADDDHENCWFPCRPVGLCTWPVGHSGQHVAGDGVRVVGVFIPERRLR